MLINTISPQNKGFGMFLMLFTPIAVSAYLFFTTMAGTISTALLGVLSEAYDTKGHPERSGYIMCAFVFFSYLGSVPWFYLAGLSYRDHLKKKELEEQLAEANNN